MNKFLKNTLLVLVILNGVQAQLDLEWLMPKTVKHVDLDQYVGRWFEQSRTFVSSEITGEGLDALCVTADYKPINSTTIQVRNADRKKRPDGTYSEANGVAYIVNPDTNAELQVDFSNKGFTGKANYYVLALGPVNNETQQYEYAVVGEPLRLFGWVLARNSEKFQSQYLKEVEVILNNLGYNKAWNKLAFTKQDNCNYPDPL